MKLYPPTVSITSMLKINDEEAFVLEHLTSYTLIDWFTTHCNGTEIKNEDIKTILTIIGNSCHLILEAKRLAEKTLKKEQ